MGTFVLLNEGKGNKRERERERTAERKKERERGAKKMYNDSSMHVCDRKSRSAFPFQFATAGVELTHLPVCIWNRLKLCVACDCVCVCERVVADEGQKQECVCVWECLCINAMDQGREKWQREREREGASALTDGFSCCPGPSL